MAAVPQIDRRSPVGDRLADVLLQAESPLRFEELMAAVPDADLIDVSAWVQHGIEARFVQEAPGLVPGDRMYRLCARGRRVLGAERRRRQQGASAPTAGTAAA
jgi:hypothetical protein